jgi:hypothetical protein
MIPGLPNGVTRLGEAQSLCAEYIGTQSKTQGTEPSQYLQEKKSTEIPGVAASETGRAQTVVSNHCGVVGRFIWESERWVLEERYWKGRPKRVSSPVFENTCPPETYLSTTGHEKSCRNLGGPPSKAQYDLATDSE